MSAPFGLRNRVKKSLEALPFGLGANILLPMVRWCLVKLLYRSPTANFRRKQIAKGEACRIQNAIDKGATEAIVVYDTYCSPPTYGDYLLVVLLARYLLARGVQVFFFITMSEYRKDWELLSGREDALVGELEQLARDLLRCGPVEVKAINWEDLNDLLAMRTQKTVIPFVDNVLNRMSIYDQCFNVLNCLLANAGNKLLSEVLFSYEQFKDFVQLEGIDMPYVTWHVRYSQKWAMERNTTVEEFLQVSQMLSGMFKACKVMIVSDVVGCDYYRGVATSHGINVLFSKDYSSSFLGDAVKSLYCCKFV